MNVKTNMLISSLSKKIKLYVPPSPDDSSQAMGACYTYQVLKYKENCLKYCYPIKDAYLGPEVDKIKINTLIKRKISKKKFKVITKNINIYAAKLLAKNKIVGRFCGKAEFGARSLGNRSILTNPSNISIKREINEKVKNRDFWMPFAASILESKSNKYFKNNLYSKNYNYMTNCVDTNKKGSIDLAAAIHPYDETCRPQIISKNQNVNYEDLINKFGKITGIYGVLNTSFNLHGFPIVNTAENAINIFLKRNLDALILENFLIVKK